MIGSPNAWRNTLARGLWLVIFILQFVVFIAGLSGWFQGLQQVCADTARECLARLALTPNDIQGLRAMGWSVEGYAWYVLLTRSALKFMGIIVGVLIFWRRPNDRMAWVASVYLIIGGDTSVAEALAGLQPAWWFLTRLLGCGGTVSFALFFYLFPTGSFVPRWTSWLWLAWVPFNLGLWFFPNTALDVNQYDTWGVILFGVVFFGSFLTAQVYRYLRVSNRIEREQTKWVVLAIVASLIGFFMAISIVISRGGIERRLNPLFLLVDFGFSASGYFLPISIGIAILRYRLFDIDLVIRRTLQYSLLSGLLALTYFGLVVVLQSVFTAVSGSFGFAQDSPVVIVLSTLAIAALFLPLRRRVQGFIDRRFYRKKYDAQKVLAEFAATARDETDLDKLTARLVEVVEETVQPESVSLWLKPTANSKWRSAVGGRSSGAEPGSES